jgi:protein-S-isoprenylcysteine O-methyltransferase Ste14
MNSSLSIPSKNISLEIATRLLWASLVSIFAVKIYNAFVQQPSINLLLLFIGELLIVGLVIFARVATKTDYRPYALLITTVATFYFLVIEVSPDQSTRLASQLVAGLIQLSGIAWQLTAKIWLGRSFGLLPAQRGLVTSGPYRIVRHPIYLGYFVSHIGILLSFFSFWNLAIYCILYIFQILRMVEEEKLLKAAPEYQAYMRKTPYRFIPFIF